VTNRPPHDIASAPIEAALSELRVDASRGLSQAEVAARLAAHGYNEVREERSPPS